MTFLTAEEKQHIADAIRAVEARTSGELVTVIARHSADYSHIPLLWAAVIALLLPVPLLFTRIPAAYIFDIQWAAFIVLTLLLQIRPLKMSLIPARVKRAHARRAAREQFHAQGLHRTSERSGVLIFVSLAEHYVEIIADEGINTRLPHDVWEKAVSDFVREVKAGRVAQGFLHIVAACGEPLAAHFPRSTGDIDELPNHLIEI